MVFFVFFENSKNNNFKFGILKKAKQMNMSNQVEFRLRDYREVKEKFDRIVSVGMF